jgi:hypothetical protein
MAMEMRGSLGLSKYFTKPNQPKFYGKCLIDGVAYEIKGWEKDGPEGKWISLCFEEKKSEEEKVRARQEEFAPLRKPHESDGDVPF